MFIKITIMINSLLPGYSCTLYTLVAGAYSEPADATARPALREQSFLRQTHTTHPR